LGLNDFGIRDLVALAITDEGTAVDFVCRRFEVADARILQDQPPFLDLISRMP
jgi:hypothetical protein